MLHLKGRRTGVAELAFSHCGRRLAAAGRGGVHVWDLADPGAPPAHPDLRTARQTGRPAFLPDGRLFVNTPHRFHLFDPAAGAVVTARVPDHFRPLVLSPDGRRVAGPGPADGGAHVWDLGPGGELSPVWSDPGGPTPTDTAFGPGSERVAFAHGMHDGRVTVRSAATGGDAVPLQPIYQNPAQLLFAPDGGRLVMRSGRGLAVVDLAAPDRKPKKVANPDRPHFAAAAFHPSGRSLATVTTDRLVRFWDAGTWTPGATFTWAIGKLYAVAFSPDGTLCAAGSHTGRVIVWDA